MLRWAPLLAVADAHYRYCPPKQAKSFLQVVQRSPEGGQALPMVPYDGYFEVGCFIDDTPEDRWIKYHEVKAKANEQPEQVTPNLCFNFCRAQNGTKFFGLYEGTKCYCTKYPTLSAGGGGQGACTSPCAGDNTFMCGDVKGKHSIYSMHRCGDTNAQAEKVNDEAKTLTSATTNLTKDCNTTVGAVTEIALKINVTENRELIMKELNHLNGLLTEASHRNDDAKAATGHLDSLVALGASKTADAMDKVEQAEADVVAKAGALKDAYTSLNVYWQQHNLGAALEAAGAADSSADDVESMDWKRLPVEDQQKFGSRITAYFSAGDHIVSLYNAKPDQKLKHRCYKACIVTPKCVAGNVFVNSDGVGTCNLKSSVKKVQLSDDPVGGSTLSGFIMNTYFNLRKGKIEFNTANLQ